MKRPVTTTTCLIAGVLGLQALATPYTVSDTFAINDTDREVGDTLYGTTTEVGSKPWFVSLGDVANSGTVTFADGGFVRFSNTVTNQARINVQVSPPSSGEVVTLRTRIRPKGITTAMYVGYMDRNNKLADFGHIYFSINPEAKMYGVFSRTNNNTAVYTVFNVQNGAAVADWSDWQDLEMAYTKDSKTLTVKLNTTAIVEAFDFNTINFTPNIQYASVMLHQRVKSDATVIPGVDSFSVSIPVPPPLETLIIVR